MDVDFLVGKIVLGIDPAIATIGYGVILDTRALDYGVISTPASLPTCKRLRQIYEDVQDLYLAYNPECIAIEMPFFGRQITSAGKVLKALGVIELALEAVGAVEPIFLHQSQIKSAIVSGKAEKREIQEQIMCLFNLPSLPKPDDAADGLAIAYAAQQGVRSDIKA